MIASMIDLVTKNITTIETGWYLLLFAFWAGILVSLTSALYSIVPITIGVITAQGPASMIHHFLLSCSYVMGLVLTYAMLTYTAATSGLMFGHWIGDERVVVIVIIAFVYLAFSMFGFYELGIPYWIIIKQKVLNRGSYLSTFVFGVISGFVVAPSIGEPLHALLIHITAIENPVLGFALIFSYALGMGLLLILIGTFAGALRHLPYAGEWMIFVERFLGFIVLFTSVIFLQPLVSTLTKYILFSLISCFAAVYYLVGMRIAWKQRCKCDAPIAGHEEIHNRRRIGKIVFLEVILALFFLLGSLFYAVRAYANYRRVSEYGLIYRLATTPPYRWPNLGIWKKLK